MTGDSVSDSVRDSEVADSTGDSLISIGSGCKMFLAHLAHLYRMVQSNLRFCTRPRNINLPRMLRVTRASYSLQKIVLSFNFIMHDGQMQRLDATVGCDGRMRRSDAPVRCTGQMHRSDAPVRCADQMRRSDATVGCNGRMRRSDAPVRCTGQMHRSDAPMH